MTAVMNVNDASNASNFASSDTSKQDEFPDDRMDVDDESPAPSTGPYKTLTVPGHPHLIAGLDFDDNFEEDEAEMSSDSDDDEEDDDVEEVETAKGISAAILLDKPIEETDDVDDGDYVPTE